MTIETVTLELRWDENGWGSYVAPYLRLGRLIAGSVRLDNKTGLWDAHPDFSAASTTHPTREAAQAALETAVLAMGVSDWRGEARRRHLGIRTECPQPVGLDQHARPNAEGQGGDAADGAPPASSPEAADAARFRDALKRLRAACDEIMEREKDNDIRFTAGAYAIAEEMRDCIDEEVARESDRAARAQEVGL